MARIALVDDEPEILEELTEYLEIRGHECVGLSSGLEFLEHVDAAPRAFDLMITDIRMPDLDGIELLRRLRATGIEAPPVIVVTGHAGKDEAEKALSEGAAAVLNKPLDLTQLRDWLVRLGLD